MTEILPDFYDVLILPPEPIQRQAIALSAQLHRHGSKWKLGVQQFMPHLSLYHLPVHPENFKEFRGALDDAVRGFRDGDLRLTGISVRRIHRAVFLETNKPPWLVELYHRVIGETISYYDENRRKEIKGLWGEMTPGMHRSFEQYGTPMTGLNFIPHFTLGAFDHEEDLDAGVHELEVKPATFRVDRLHVGLVGTGFTCQGVIHEAVF